MLPKGKCQKMSAELNSTMDDRSSSTYADAHGSELIAGNESEVPVRQTSLEVRSVCGSNAAESMASVAGMSFPFSDGAICSGSTAGVVIGAIP